MGPKLIILRHGEKPKDDTHGKSSLELAPKGKARAQFLAEKYLGRGATASLFGRGRPHVFFAVTPHTIETASPSAESWDLPVTAFCTAATKKKDKECQLDRRTRQACDAIRDVLLRDLNVVVVWEHHRIADARQPELPTLRTLLGLDRLRVKATWADADFDTIWLVECEPDGTPRSCRTVRQRFVYRPARKTGKKAKAGNKAKVKHKASAKAKRGPKPGRP